MIIPIKNSFKPFANLLFRIVAKIHVLIQKNKQKSWQDYPVIINNFNRLAYLQQQIAWLEKVGMKNIYIIDNASTYLPLLDFYKKTKYTVFQLNENVGHLALWQTHIFKYFENTYYIYTDPDIVPIEECPLNAVEYFKEILDKYPKITKVGFGLKIDDLPDYYPLKEKVINWEKKYWQNEMEKNIYKSKIDTTFALYRPNRKGGWELLALRTGGKYTARHLPWYINMQELDIEEKYFIKLSSKSSSWYNRKEIYND